MDLQLRGRRALVTGSSSGIGIGVVEILAREGASVIVHGRDEQRTKAVAEAIRAEGGSAACAVGDLATDEGAAAVAEAALDAFGGVDILVNNAGGRTGSDGAADWFGVTPQDWADTYQMNTIAALRMIRHLGPAMKERGWGRLIQVSSSAANSPNAIIPHYATAKAAIINMTMGLSKAYAKTGVTAVTVSPGMVSTPSLERWFLEIADEKGWTGDDRRDRAEAWVLKHLVHQTVARVGHVHDIGTLIAYLSSPLADFVNGANFRCDGGRSPGVN